MTEMKQVSFKTAITPIAFFFILLIYGLFIHPKAFGQSMLPVEILVLLALSFNAFLLLYLGYSWETIQKKMIEKVSDSITIILILLSVGVLIGSWIVSGTIPMLIYYGISIIDPNWVYIFSFLICIIFSLLTGTSWGSAGTIGVVMIGISQVYDANLAITAGAIVGGSFFGDKMSPLSDTTNIASLATNVPVYEHIHSMIYTTGPSAILAAIVYICLSPALFGGTISASDQPLMVQETLTDLQSVFNFNILLLIPLVIILWGSFTKKPIILTLLGSAWTAMILALIFQSFSLNHILETLNRGFNMSMLGSSYVPQSDVVNILNRGGLYSLIPGVIICVVVFAFIGTLDVINAIHISIETMMKSIKTRAQTIAAALTATLFGNMAISNQYATSFIIGATFNKKFDDMKINRKVLSRSIEDAGTMMENLAPWTPSGLFMIGALGVSALEYAPYQFLSLINIVVAYFFALTGIACFYGAKDTEKDK